MQIGTKNGKHYYLEQNPLTKEIYIEVHNWNNGKQRTYTSKNMIRKIFCMLV